MNKIKKWLEKREVSNRVIICMFILILLAECIRVVLL